VFTLDVLATIILDFKNFVCFTVIKYSVTYAQRWEKWVTHGNFIHRDNRNESAQRHAVDFSPRNRRAGAIFVTPVIAFIFR